MGEVVNGWGAYGSDRKGEYLVARSISDACDDALACDDCDMERVYDKSLQDGLLSFFGGGFYLGGCFGGGVVPFTESEKSYNNFLERERTRRMFGHMA